MDHDHTTTHVLTEEGPAGIVQPCSEACECFQRLAAGGWSDYGVCTNPRSPLRGFPVLPGQSCRVYQPAMGRPQPHQA